MKSKSIRNRKIKRVVKKNTEALITAITTLWTIHKFNSAIIMSTQPSSNVQANDIHPTEQDREVLKAWDDIWVRLAPLANEMNRAGWIDGKRVQATFDKFAAEIGKSH